MTACKSAKGRDCMKLIFVRHGQTEWNARRLLQGSTDIPLNAEGFAQAEALHTQLAATPIDFAVCSPLIRARQTAEVICRGRQIPLAEDSRIAERGFGRFEGAFFDRARFDGWWLPEFDGTADQIESLDVFCERVASLLDELSERFPRQTVLMVAHGGVSIAVQRYFFGSPKTPAEAADFLPNCRPAIFKKE